MPSERSHEAAGRRVVGFWGCTPKPSKIPSKWISDFHSLVQPSFADIGSIFTATIPFVAEELRSISMRCWQTWHWKKATKGSLKPSNYGFDPIRPRNVMANCLTEFSRVWASNPWRSQTIQESFIIAAQLNIFQTLAIEQGVVSQVQHVITFVIG